MVQTTLPNDDEFDDKPQAMLFDGWSFVPLSERDLIARAPQAQAPIENEAV